MAGVPDQAIAAKVVDRMQRETQFDDAQIRGEVSRARRHQITEDFANLVGQLLQLRRRTIRCRSIADSIVGRIFAML